MNIHEINDYRSNIQLGYCQTKSAFYNKPLSNVTLIFFFFNRRVKGTIPPKIPQKYYNIGDR